MRPTLLVICIVPLLGACEAPITRIAFGGCANQDRPQPIWDAINTYQPEIFIFNGDNIYGDTEDMDVLRRKYALLGEKPGFKALRENTTVLATWDDHDYGKNDGGADYPQRRASQHEFAEFFRLPPDSPVRHRPGVYDAHFFGPNGRRVQVILLDTRYFRSPLATRSDEERRRTLLGPYAATGDPSSTLLGTEQWRWLEDQLRIPAQVRIIVTSVQAVSTQHGWESWGSFPHERDRLFRLIRDTGAGGVLFISGDRHMAELSRSDEGPYPLYDLTASGLNMANGGRPDEPNPYRLYPMYRENNFGTLTIDWDALGGLHVTLAARDRFGAVIFEHTIPLSQLQPDARLAE